jgi:signal transduction histidine kinase
LTERTIGEIRRIIAALSPTVLEQLGLAAALRQLANRFRGVYPGRVRLNLPARLAALPRETAIAAFRLAQECFNNIAKHSQASTVNLSLHSTDRVLWLMVNDDGIGFEVKAALEKQGSFGLTGMRERVALLGGKLEIVSQPRRGTRISVELPIANAGKKGSVVRATQNAR